MIINTYISSLVNVSAPAFHVFLACKDVTVGSVIPCFALVHPL